MVLQHRNGGHIVDLSVPVLLLSVRSDILAPYRSMMRVPMYAVQPFRFYPHLLVLLCSTCMFLLSGSLRAQIQNGDSLLDVWNDQTRPDSVRYSACFDLIYDVLLYEYPDSALAFAQSLERFTGERRMAKAQGSAMNLVASCLWAKAELVEAQAAFLRTASYYSHIEEPTGEAAALVNLGTILLTQGSHDSGEVYIRNGLAVLARHGMQENVAMGLNNLAVMYNQLGLQAKAIPLYHEAIAALEKVGNTTATATAQGNLGMIYADLHDWDHARELFEEGEKRLLTNGDTALAAGMWSHLGSLWHERDSLILAKAYWERSKGVYERVDRNRHLAVVLNNLGQVYMREGSIDTAQAYHERAMLICERLDDAQCFAQSLQAMGEVALMEGRIKEAIALGERGMGKAELAGDLERMEKLHDLLSHAYDKAGMMDKAYEHANSLLLLRDSIRTDDEQRILLRSEYAHENDRRALTDSLTFASEKIVKDKEIQKQKVIRNGFVGGFALVALFASIFFIQRNRISKEKARSEELLLNILPAEVAEELKAKGEAQAVQVDQVTVLFSDFKGFTSLSEKLTPKELVRDLNECFSAFDRIMTKHGIEKIKTIGDAYMAAGGLPVPNATHAVDVVKAGLEMRGFIAEGKARKLAAGLPFFEIRIGIHTGPVVAGIVGVKKFQYDIWGDTVNTASRMESSGEAGQVNISEATYALVKNASTPVGMPAFVFAPRGLVQAKGKGELHMWFVEPRT